MKKFRSPALFALALAPVALIAGILSAYYQLDMLDPAMVSEAIAQLGSKGALVAIAAVQTVIYAVVCGFLGHILATRLDLMKPLRITKKPLVATLTVSLIAGVIFSLDPWIFGKFLPDITGVGGNGLSGIRFFTSVLYGGIIEELMLRLFVMSLIAFILWKIFFRKCESVPACALIIANIASAMLFAAGHLPATIALFGNLTPMILVRCFLLNGGFGLIFGVLYTKYGIQYAMISHATLHIISQFIWYIA